MSKRQLRRFGTMVPPGNNRPDVPVHGAVFTPDPIETSQPEMVGQHGMRLHNPDAEPTIDRKRPRPLDARQRDLGLARRPTNINDVAPGDAAAGKSEFRRGQFFTQLTSTIPGGGSYDVVDLIWDKPIGLATGRSSDTRPRFWHVSFFNYGTVRQVAAGTVNPLTEAEIQTAAGRGPSVAMVRGRVQIFDESGGRFFDVDILGTRSFSFYAFGVTANILLPNAPDGSDISVEINAQATTQPALGPGLVEDSFAAARIIPIFQNATQIIDTITSTVTVPLGGVGSIQIPPGTTRVQLRTSFDRTAIPADYIIAFSAGPAFTAPNSVGQIFVIPGTTETDTIEVPNANFITFVDSVGVPSLKTWIATFTVEA